MTTSSVAAASSRRHRLGARCTVDYVFMGLILIAVGLAIPGLSNWIANPAPSSGTLT